MHQWVRGGLFQRIAEELVEDLYERRQIDIRGAFIDYCFAPTKKGIPVAAYVKSTSLHEVKLVDATIDSSFTQYASGKLIGDKANDSDRLDQ